MSPKIDFHTGHQIIMHIQSQYNWLKPKIDIPFFISMVFVQLGNNDICPLGI
jgi:hypothetical protein